VNTKQFTVADWETHIRKSPTRCKEHINKAVIQYQRGDLSLSSSQQNLLEAAINTGDF